MTTEQMLADQAQVFADFPQETIAIGAGDAAVTYDCLILSLNEQNTLIDGGVLEQPGLVVAIERSLFTGDLPIDGTFATFRDADWRVAMVRENDLADSVQITLQSSVDER